MCNLYSQTKTREAVGNLFMVSHNRTVDFDPQLRIRPSERAPAVRRTPDGDREIALLSWGFPFLQKGYAPKRVTNTRDDKIDSLFWSASFKERRCLLPVTSFSEKKHWFSLDAGEPLFAFAGLWRHYRGPVKKDGEIVEIDVYSLLTTTANATVGAIHHRMPVLLAGEADQDTWLDGTEDEARALIHAYPDDLMTVTHAPVAQPALL